MILPNADLRCTAAQALEDEYWVHKELPAPSHREYGRARLLQKLIYAAGKGGSVSHAPSLSLGLDKDVFKFSDIISTWSPRSIAEKDKKENDRDGAKERSKPEQAKKRGANKENDAVKRGRQEESPKLERRTSKSGHTRSHSQPKLLLAEGEHA